MSKMYSTANLSDKELKEQGNRLFNLQKYEDAAYCYTKAIVSDSMNICRQVTTLHLISADQKSIPSVILYEPSIVSPEIEKMGIILPRLQACSRYRSMFGKGSLFLGSCSPRIGTLR